MVALEFLPSCSYDIKQSSKNTYETQVFFDAAWRSVNFQLSLFKIKCLTLNIMVREWGVRF